LVSGDRIVQVDRQRGVVFVDAGVLAKFGVAPRSIPDFLALVGDAQDGIPGVPKWGAKSTATVLRRWQHVAAIPPDAADWQLDVRGAKGLAQSLAEHRDEAALYRTLATLRTDVPIAETLDDLRFCGPGAELAALCEEIGFARFVDRFDGGQPSPVSPG
jgi:5'-3' exonuclease